MAARGITQTGNSRSPIVVIPVRKAILANKDKEKRGQDESGSIHYKSRRLIVPVEPSFLEEFNPTSIRDRINDKFFTQLNMNEPVVTTVTKSKSQQSVVLTTMPRFTAKWFQEKKETWQDILPCRKTTLDEKWVKIVVHTVPIGPFSLDEGPNMLKDDIETYNGVKLMRTPVWLTSEEKRGTQKHGSILIHLENQNAAQQLLKFRMSVAGVPVKAQKFTDRSVQSSKCQTVGHQSKDCVSAARCRLCAGDHHTKAHKCQACNAATLCAHTSVKCANCLQAHQADDAKCVFAKKPRIQKPRPGQQSPGNKMLLD
jgi:hypothetical protein